MTQGTQVAIQNPRRLSPAQRQVVAEIVRLLLPDQPALGARERVRVESAVTGFVASQIEALPGFLALPYRATLGAFQLFPALRFGRRFGNLDDDAKAAWLALWSDGPIAPARDFTKLIRSCALLAYFDHPDVRSQLPHPGGVEAVGATP
jgi:hypothetical protein